MDNNLISVALKKILTLVKMPPLQVAARCDSITSQYHSLAPPLRLVIGPIYGPIRLTAHFVLDLRDTWPAKIDFHLLTYKW